MEAELSGDRFPLGIKSTVKAVNAWQLAIILAPFYAQPAAPGTGVAITILDDLPST